MKHKTLRTVLDLLPMVMLLLGGFLGLLDYLFIGGGFLVAMGGVFMALGILSILIPMPYSDVEKGRYAKLKDAHDIMRKKSEV